uniref:AP complex mu/sigma subunit domain-containing protein n=1 Tax=Nothobranchius furzeri TaxID=105023 RepID=A0A8C6LZG4_NOTFU
MIEGEVGSRLEEETNVGFSLTRRLNQIMFHLDSVHIILDEMIQNGHIVETNKNRILAPLTAINKMADG